MELNDKLESSSAVTVDYLPDDILLEIFKYFNYEELCKYSQVCRRWFRISHFSSLRKKIIISTHLSGRQLSFLSCYHFHEHLQELQIGSDLEDMIFMTKATVFSLKAKCPELKRLKLTYCSLRQATLLDLPTSLRYLSVRQCEINPYDFFTYQPQNFLPYLKCLDVGRVINFLTSEDLYIFKNLNSLRCLNLEGCFRINNGGLESIKEVIEHLEVLNVESTDISDEGVQTILSHGTMLKELFVGYNNLTDIAFENMDNAKLPTLQTLCVRSTKVTSFSVTKLVKTNINVIYDHEQYGDFLKDLVKKISGHPKYCNHSASHSCSY